MMLNVIGSLYFLVLINFRLNYVINFILLTIRLIFSQV